MIIKRGKTATEYMKYCEEVGCDIWGVLVSMKSLCNEPVCLWLPKEYIKPGTSDYVQGVEVPKDYNGEIPEDSARTHRNEGVYRVGSDSCKSFRLMGWKKRQDDMNKIVIRGLRQNNLKCVFGYSSEHSDTITAEYLRKSM